jgi:hypothetical protein
MDQRIIACSANGFIHRFQEAVKDRPILLSDVRTKTSVSREASDHNRVIPMATKTVTEVGRERPQKDREAFSFNAIPHC